MKTSELVGAELDYWVARAEGHEWRCHWLLEQKGMQAWQQYEQAWGSHTKPYSSEWEFGGPLIEKYQLVIDWLHNGKAVCVYYADTTVVMGDTPLQAICRAVVRSVFGDEVNHD